MPNKREILAVMTKSIETPVLPPNLDFENVYEPVEDSFVLLDALEKDLDFIEKEINPSLCVEIGSGSGIISTALASVLPPCQIIAFDINSKACDATKQTASANNVSHKIDIITLDFLQWLPLRDNCVDLLVCNPPYVATDNNEVGHNDIKASWAGGSLGRNLTDQLIQMLPKILSKNEGCAYIVLEQCNHPESVREMAKSLNMYADFVLSRRAGREFLSVLKIKHGQ